MAESIEAFVQKLQQEGVEAGRAQAQQLLADAQAQAARALADAQQQAKQIVDQAKSKAQQELQQGRSELELAARDAVLALRQVLSRTLTDVLRLASAQALKDEKLLVELIRDVVSQYAAADAKGANVELHVDKDRLEAVARWALAQAGGEKPRVDLKGPLESAGFEYRATGGTVEVTPDSVAGVLADMLSPVLREMVDRSAQGLKK